MRFYVYIIHSESSDIYYIGFTTNPEKRLNEHNSGLGRYTSKNGPWNIVYLEEFSCKEQALKREKAIKRYNHDYLKILINSSTNIIRFFKVG